MIRILAILLVFAACGAACSSRNGDTGVGSAGLGERPGTATTTSSPIPATTPQTRFTPNPPADGATVCDRFATITDAGIVATSDLTETSGVIASRRHAGVFWLHNDSGGDAAVYAIDGAGNELATWTLDGVNALDWEDVAIGPGPEPGIDYLYVADIGDNLAFRPDVTIHRFAEPDPTVSGVVTDTVALRLGYPMAATDAEALLVDPIDGDVVIITKTDTGRSAVLRASASGAGSDPIIAMSEIAMLDLGAGSFVTAADISPDGTMIALRGYEEVWMWARNDRELSNVFSAEPCSAPSPVEVQGEALTFTADGSEYVTVSEGTNPTVWRVGG